MPSFHQPPPLDEPFFGVKIPCPGGRHAPWPASICTLCQPSAVALNMQPFRHVDHVQFASHGIVNDFIEFWRTSGTQRFGFMYGRYERHPEVPLGIKAVVEVIYEPRQHNMQDGLSVDFDHWWSTESKIADDIASKCGLQRVGCIFTDLEDDSTGRGTVLVKRHKDAFFMSSVETCFAADLQKRHPSACKWSSTGQHGSKFVTCIITGNDKGGIDISAYQVSDATVALRDADLIVASTDPSMMLVAEETDGKYVQEIIYRYVNEYNTPVSSTAKPAFPVEYLLVNLTSGTPEKEDALFKSSAMFSIENRQSLLGAAQQGYAELHQHLEKAIKNNAQDGGYVKALSDFHLLVYLKTTDMFSDDELSLLTRIAIGQETASTANRLLEGCSGWQTLLTVLQSMDTTQTTSSGSGSSSTNRQQNSTWSCQHCTMINEGGDDDCSMCGLPRNS
ncbi:NPL4-domain-containing protein [Ramicandelaber brevisporus]|nr:NPL4-domain-containing protein [Ramicandelaber brevisporus]